MSGTANADYNLFILHFFSLHKGFPNQFTKVANTSAINVMTNVMWLSCQVWCTWNHFCMWPYMATCKVMEDCLHIIATHARQRYQRISCHFPNVNTHGLAMAVHMQEFKMTFTRQLYCVYYHRLHDCTKCIWDHRRKHIINTKEALQRSHLGPFIFALNKGCLISKEERALWVKQLFLISCSFILVTAGKNDFFY